MQCHQFREIADSYLGNELSVETNHAVNSHLERCVECRKELVARRELHTKLREAFINAPANQMRPEFAVLLRSHLQDTLDQPNSGVESLTDRSSLALFPRTRWVAIAACLVIAVGIGLVLLLSSRTQPNDNRESIAKTSAPSNSGLMVAKTELANSAVGDHRDCAIHYRLAERPIDLEEAGRKYDPTYSSLTKAVLSISSASPDIEFVEAHSCVFEERRFAHIVLRYHGRVVSLVVTDNGNTNETTEPIAATAVEHPVIACSQFDGYRVSCFETAHHAVFVVSDLSEGENLALARALAPSVVAHIIRTERTA